jgi:sugar phosphate isomerase/epimerase
MTLLSMNELTTYRWSLEEDIEHFLEAGYRAIGAWRQKLSDCDDERAIELFAASELAVSNLGWAGGFTGSDGRTLEESIEDAQDAIRLAAAINAGCLVIYAGGRNNHTIRHATRLFLTALDDLLPLAEAAGVPLAVEPMHAACAADWTFYTSLPPVLDLLDEYQSPYLKLALDTYHFPCDDSGDSLLQRLAPHLAIVHLSDRRFPHNIDQERCPLGCGQVPLREMITSLHAAGYAGPFDIKLIGTGGEIGDYWTLLEHSQSVFTEFAGAIASRTLA